MKKFIIEIELIQEEINILKEFTIDGSGNKIKDGERLVIGGLIDKGLIVVGCNPYSEYVFITAIGMDILKQINSNG